MSPRIRIGIVGLNFGSWVAEHLAKSGEARQHFDLVAVCDLDAQRTDAVAARLGARAVYHVDEMLADSGLQAIGIYTKPMGRAELLRRVLRAGKDIMTTKPFELDPQSALEVLCEARSLGRVIHLNSPGPTTAPDLLQIRDWRERFNLGAPVGCRAESWASYREAADGSWYDDPHQCPVAPVFRLGIYLINDLVQIFGEAESVQTLHSRLFTQRPTPDNAQLGIRFKNGALATVFASFCVSDNQPYLNSLVLNFENGTIHRRVGNPELNTAPRTVSMSLVTAKGETAQIQLPISSGDYQWEAFARAIRGEPLENATSAEQIVAGLQIVAAMACAEQSGRTEMV